MVDAPVHSLVSPSSAYAWTECTAMPGYVEREKPRLPPDDTTYSYEGQVAHAVAAWLLNPAMVILPEYRKYLDADKERSTQIWLHADHHAKLARSMMRPGDRMVVEYRAPLYYYPQHRGTIDIAIVCPDRILIIDLKYGVGVGVYAVKNKQLAIYAESLIRTLELIDAIADSVQVVMLINQPRDRNDPEPIRRWETTRGELREFAMPIGTIAKIIVQDPHSKNLRFVANPSVQCFFCKAKGICKTLAEYELQGIEVLPDDQPVDMVLAPRSRLAMPEPRSLTRDQRVKIVKHRKDFEAWLEAVENQEIADQMNNQPHPDFKMVEGKSNRVWTDRAAVVKLLEFFEVDPWKDREMIGPAGAEELCKGRPLLLAEINKLIYKPPGKPTLVEASDKRRALDFKDPLHGIDDLDQPGNDLI